MSVYNTRVRIAFSIFLGPVEIQWKPTGRDESNVLWTYMLVVMCMRKNGKKYLVDITKKPRIIINTNLFILLYVYLRTYNGVCVCIPMRAGILIRPFILFVTYILNTGTHFSIVFMFSDESAVSSLRRTCRRISFRCVYLWRMQGNLFDYIIKQ
jgi:hypothetical protein